MSFMAVQLAKRGGPSAPIDDGLDRAVTVRPSSTALFGIDSKDRYATYSQRVTNPTSPYDFAIVKQQSLLNGFFSRIALTEIVLPWYIPNITDEVTSINVVTSTGTTLITIAGAGAFLTPDEIAANLQTEIQTVSGLSNVGVAYVDGAFAFVDITTPTPPQFAFARVAPVESYQLFDFLNLNKDNTVLREGEQYSGPTRCRWTEYVDVVCSQLTYNQDLKDGSSARVERDVLARIYLEFEDDKTQPVFNSATDEIELSDLDIPGVSPFTINRKFPMPKQILWDKTAPLGNLTFQLYDDKGRILSYNVADPLDEEENPFMQFDYKLPDWRFTLLVSEN
jgi:hypothetical protein